MCERIIISMVTTLVIVIVTGCGSDRGNIELKPHSFYLSYEVSYDYLMNNPDISPVEVDCYFNVLNKSSKKTTSKYGWIKTVPAFTLKDFIKKYCSSEADQK